MNLANELEKLAALHQSGALSEEEYARAKQNLIEGARPSDSVGKAANRFVSFHMIFSIVALIIIAIFFFTVFLPRFREISGFMQGMSPSESASP